MPTGARFALEIFKHNFEPARELFKTQRDSLSTGEYFDWLPPKISPRIASFGPLQWRKVSEETLDAGRDKIVATIDGFDSRAADLLSQCGIDEAQFKATFERERGYRFGERLYGSQIVFSDNLRTTKLFESRFFSAALDLCHSQPTTLLIPHRVNAIIRLLSGALGQDLVRSLNDDVFRTRPKDLEALDVGELFSVNLAEAGQPAFDLVLNERRIPLNRASTLESMVSELLLAFIEQIVEESISYQRLMDEYYPYLFKPRDQFAKFTRISVFLHGVRGYVADRELAAEAAFLRGDGYYQDVRTAERAGKVAILGIGTSNYTSFASRAFTAPYYLNGRLVDQYDPYLNRLIRNGTPAPRGRFIVPLLFTQSGVKPMTSVEMSARYVSFYKDIKRSKALVVAGYGFNGDDGHINGLLRYAVDIDRKRIVILSFGESGTDDDVTLRYVRKLRLKNATLVSVLRLDGKRQVESRPWMEAVVDAV